MRHCGVWGRRCSEARGRSRVFTTASTTHFVALPSHVRTRDTARTARRRSRAISSERHDRSLQRTDRMSIGPALDQCHCDQRRAERHQQLLQGRRVLRDIQQAMIVFAGFSYRTNGHLAEPPLAGLPYAFATRRITKRNVAARRSTRAPAAVEGRPMSTARRMRSPVTSRRTTE